jgi:hypothetical protein
VHAREQAQRLAFAEAESIARAEGERVSAERAAALVAEQDARQSGAGCGSAGRWRRLPGMAAEQDARDAEQAAMRTTGPTPELADRRALDLASRELADEMQRRSGGGPVPSPEDDHGHRQSMEHARQEIEETAARAAAAAPFHDVPAHDVVPAHSEPEDAGEPALWEPTDPDDGDVSAMLREISATSALPPAEPAAEPEPSEEPAEAKEGPYYAQADTDMASLLRELSSLGFGDETPPPPPPPPVSRPAPAPPAAVEKKKRKGLFGR